MFVKRTSSRFDEAGFTLIELIVVMAVVGIIMVPLSAILINYFLNNARISARLGESHDEQIAAAYWQQDVASIGVRSSSFDTASNTFPFKQSVSTQSSFFPCTLPSGTVQVVLAWNQYDSSGNPTLNSVAYLTNGTTLVRAACTGSSGPPSSVATVAHLLNGTPTVQCFKADGTALGCGDAFWSGASPGVPASVAMTFSVRDPTRDGTPYTVTLTGERRQT